MIKSFRLALLPMAVLACGAVGASADATTAAGAVASPSAATSAVAPVTPGRPVVKISGFRSAHFGMTETQVRSAIKQDFSVTGEAINAGQNPGERTKILSVAVPDLLPNGGKAEVAYVFGYQSHMLMQVGITWSKTVDPATTLDTLVSNAAALQALFLADGYKPGSVITNVALANGGVTLLFRGQDADDHVTNLLLEGTTAAGANGTKQFTPAALNLIYVENALHPDVMKLKQGSF